LPPDIITAEVEPVTGPSSSSSDGIEPLSLAVDQFERQYVRRVLERVGGHRGRAAALLGISRKSLWQRLRDKPE
jgi:DNA-binding NtrC family response regulator